MDTSSSLLNTLEKLKGRHLLTIGDVMLDQFVYGDIHRISPEAPVPVLSAGRRVVTAGGVGNVAANLRGLDVSVTLVSVTGDDAARVVIDKIFNDLGIDAQLVTSATRPTTQKDRYVAGTQHMLRVDAETTDALSPDDETKIIAALNAAAKTCDAIIVSDYGKGVITPNVLKAVFALNKPVFVDPKGSDYTRYKGATLITPNRKELSDATGNMPTATDDDVVAAATALLKSCGARAILATRSADGITIVDGHAPVHLRAQAREVFDVSGAGDTVVATTAAAMAAGATLHDAAQLANIAAGIVVQKSGTAAINTGELRRAVLQIGGTIAPVLSWDEAKAQVDAWKAQGLTVGFTNGCFDILHTGHVTMLNRAAQHCDKLVMGINTDASVKRLKGPTRPVNDEQSRARVIAGLGSIDAVVFFGDDASEGDTPLKVITRLVPDRLFKGADYTAATVVGADVVTKNGGQVVLLPLEDGYSTTNTIKKMGAA